MTWVTEEFVVEMSDGTYDWIDPVICFEETEDQLIVNNGSFIYAYDKSKVKQWTVREYSPETTYDKIGEE